ncbi:FG-GAP repeat domain-containing protein [Streptomyces sp. SS]|uniref:FG-GAP repeat domain-containing protein n=1 Tax=Streptomyces sp. SS TaxID=260742 RepID=UPI0002F4CCD9|nr:VCBS repeat-containing protein [Streptomyces sp. SS]
MDRSTNRSRLSGRRLGVAVLVSLAVTAGVPGALPAVAAPSAEAGAANATAAVPYGAGDRLWGLGRTGFLTLDGTDPNIVHWTRLVDGSVSTFPAGHFLRRSVDSDIVVDEWREDGYTLKDMAAGGQDLLRVSLSQVGSGARYVGAVRSTLLVSTVNSTGGKDLHLYEPGEGAPAERTVTGLPADFTGMYPAGAAGDDVVLSYTTGSGGTRHHWAILNLKSATVTTHRDLPGASSAPAVSATHIAWTESNASGVATVVVQERATGKIVQRTPMAEPGQLSVHLVGDWVTYSRHGGLEDFPASPLHALTARKLTDGTTRRLLDHTVSAIDAPDGAFGVRGGTVAGGEGLYKIAPGADGVPVVTRLAATGEPTKVALVSHTIPTTVDLDRNGGRLDMAWQLSRNNVSMTVTIRNTRTGESWTENALPSLLGEDYPQPMRATWTGALPWNGVPDIWTAAPAGPYTWEITAQPLNDIGPALKTSGSFTVTRKTGLHDYDADGSPDVLARDTSGRLLIGDAFYSPYGGQLDQAPLRQVGTGWQVYDRIEAAGNLGGSAVSDVVTRDKSGGLWLYKGTGVAKSPLAARVRIGTGWQVYDQFTGGSDLTNDGRPDLVATDKTGGLWLYPGTGNANAPFSTRKKIGTGWGTYNQITATGDIAGAPAGDLVARDRAGNLWMYLGLGNGTFAPRTKIGTGWGPYDQLLGIGDANRDGRPDLYAAGPYNGGPEAYLYNGTGSWKTPLRAREMVSAFGYDPERFFNLFA